MGTFITFQEDCSKTVYIESILTIPIAYVVSCRHVVNPTKSKRDLTPNNEPIWIRVNREQGKPKEIKTKRSEWMRHPDKNIDLCVYCFDQNKENADDELEYGTLALDGDDPIILTKEGEEKIGLSLGDEVFMAGVFVGRVGADESRVWCG